MYSQIHLATNQISLKDIGQNLKKKGFILDYFDKNWSEKLQVNQQNANVSLESYLDNINSILDTCTNAN